MPKPHPISRFNPPKAITKGTPLKSYFDEALVALISESFSRALKTFDGKTFQNVANAGLDKLELKGRAHHIANALLEVLPKKPTQLADALIASLGPTLEKTEDNGLQGFFYMPHAAAIECGLSESFGHGMRACYEITRRFTAEFCIRPFIDRYPERAIERLTLWLDDPDPHVRRLVSEGARPRLPWASRLPKLIEDPSPILPLLRALRDDPELYVRRSVANNLGDIAKDHLSLVLDLTEAWLAEVGELQEQEYANRLWLIRHALRHPTKKGDRRAISLRKAAGWRG